MVVDKPRAPVPVVLREQLCLHLRHFGSDFFRPRGPEDVAIANQPGTANSLGLDIE